jgi:hypothetical protein
MKIITVIIIITISSFFAMADSSGEAMKKTAEAFSKTKIGKNITQGIETAAFKLIPVERSTAATISSMILTIAQGKVDTKSIKKMNILVKKGSVRPDIEYDFKENNSLFLLKYSFGF